MNTSNSHITGRFNELIQPRRTTQRQIDGAKAVHGHIWEYPKTSLFCARSTRWRLQSQWIHIRQAKEDILAEDSTQIIGNRRYLYLETTTYGSENLFTRIQITTLLLYYFQSPSTQADTINIQRAKQKRPKTNHKIGRKLFLVAIHIK